MPGFVRFQTAINPRLYCPWVCDIYIFTASFHCIFLSGDSPGRSFPTSPGALLSIFPAGWGRKSACRSFPRPPCSVYSSFPRNPSEVIPRRIRRAVVPVQARQAGIPAVVQTAARRNETPHFSLHDPYILYRVKRSFRGVAPPDVYAVRSPRFPLAESRAR